MKSGRGITLLVMLLVTVLVPTGFAASVQPALVLSMALQSIPSDGASHPAFFITVENGAGKPTPLKTSLNVTLACSDTRALQLPEKTTIPAGSYYVIVNASSTIQDKRTVEVSVSASGYSSSKLNAVVEPPAGSPKALKVTLLPDIITPDSGASTIVTVTIIDSYGKPAKARADLTVTLSSSNLQIVDISPRTIKISQGSYSGSANIISKGYIGNAIVTASASNLKTDSATVKVAGAKSEKLSLWTQSSFVNGDSGLLFVNIVDSGLKPAKVSERRVVRLYSSNTTVLMVPSSVTIEGDDWITNATVTCLNTGTAKIFAMSDNLASASVTVSVITNTNTVASVKINVVASYLPADEIHTTYLALQTVDSTGKPARLANSKIITLFSSDAAVLDLDAITTMETGNSVNYVKALPKLAGTSKITVGTTNIGGSDVTVNVYSPQATTLILIAPPIPADGEVTACLVALSTGVPAPLAQSTLIQLSSTDTQIADVDSSAILTAKNYYTTFSLSGRSPGQFSLTAIGSGLPSSSATLQVYEVRPSVFKVAYVKPLAQTEFPIVVQAVSSLGMPVVTDAIINVNLASSNMTVITIPEVAIISAEDSNALAYGLAASEGKTTLTLSSGDFTALSVEITAQAMIGGLTLSSVDRYRSGGAIKITAEIIMDNSPVSGTEITWSGKGLYATTTTTDSSGKSENIITLSEGVNIIEAKVDLPGLGQLTAQKRVLGVRQYTLEVASNIGTEIEGSGSYAEGAIKKISAPASIELTGILGILGVKQVFKQWTGMSESTNSTVEVVFTGESKQLALLAEYETDYIGLIIRIGLMTVVFVVVVVGLTLWRRRSE